LSVFVKPTDLLQDATLAQYMLS